MARLKVRSGTKKKSSADEIRDLSVAIREMKSRISAYDAFRGAVIEVAIRPDSDQRIREYVGPLVGKRSSGVLIHQLVSKSSSGVLIHQVTPKKKKAAKKKKAEQESA